MVLEFRPPKYGENGEVNRGDGSSFIDISGYHAIRDDIDRSVYRVGFTIQMLLIGRISQVRNTNLPVMLKMMAGNIWSLK